MALNEKNYELINEFMEQVCRLASLNSPRLFMDALKGFTSDKGIGGDGWWVTTEFFEAATMTESDIEYLGGRKFDGVVFDEAFNMRNAFRTENEYNMWINRNFDEVECFNAWGI